MSELSKNEHLADAIFHLQCFYEKLDELQDVENPVISEPRIRKSLRHFLNKVKPWNKFSELLYEQDDQLANELTTANEYLRDLILHRPNVERLYISKIVSLFNEGEIPISEEELTGETKPLENEKLVRIKRI